ncbi:unnamed protein product [Amaranthus hypochondriacus]
MEAYYHTHNHNIGKINEIQENNSNNFHTLIFMNPNLANPQNHQQPPQSPPCSSHNILLLNSAAASLSPHHHQLVTLPNSSPQSSNVMLYGYPSQEAREVPRATQGLSLSLFSHNSAINGCGSHQGGEGLVLGSKYLKAAQELLDEVVHVGDDGGFNNKGVVETPSEEKEKLSDGGGGGGAELSTTERQEIQMKKAKLVAMLDEAEQRYKQYNQQMRIVIESFEQAAGIGSAKTYTALALKTISKQFRCLKDAIQEQIRTANKSLGDDQEGGSGTLPCGKIEGSRLKFIDHQIRQQRAFQQLGMIQNPTAWRPQRGLPERSVSVLRAWLFEHFLHPYPKDSDKIMLAKQAGLTRSQVSNWFINARVRLWKPMIEEMYKEELKEQEQKDGVSEEKALGSSKENSTNEENIQENMNNGEQNNGASTTSFIPITTNSITPFKGNDPMTQTHHGFSLNVPQRNPKRQRDDHVLGYENGADNGEILIKFGDEKQESGNEGGYPIISGGMNFLGGGELGSYPIGDIGRFETHDFSTPTRFFNGNGISLSLGLPPSCETHPHGGVLDNLSTTNHSFLSSTQNIQFRRTNEFGGMNSPPSHSSASAFECLEMQNRKGFAPQLLQDFVA